MTLQVISAARWLTVRRESEAAHQNMASFKPQVLTEAMDDIVTLEDFLAASESQVLEDVVWYMSEMEQPPMDTKDWDIKNAVGDGIYTYQLHLHIQGEKQDRELHNCIFYIYKRVETKNI